MGKNKIAVLVVGSHHSGKSKTINEYLKPLLGIKIRAYTFFRNDHWGYVISQSIEESGRDVNKFLDKCKSFDIIILSCRPRYEKISHLDLISKNLLKISFNVFEIEILENPNESYYKDKAKEIINIIDINTT